MTLSVSDIERWSAEDVRAVASAVRSRGQALVSAAEGLPSVGEWAGEAAAVAGEALSGLLSDLGAHGSEALAVASAADRAADSIEAVVAGLARLRVEAASFGLRVERASGRIMPVAGSERLGWAQAPALQARLDWIVEQADSIDGELAAALRGDSGAAPASGWGRLSRSQRDEWFARDPAVGNTPGMPAGSEFTFDADHYNRRHLSLELSRADDGPVLDDLRAVREVLAANPGARLMLFDTSGDQVHAAVAIGDPDTATHVSVTAPGLNTTVRGELASMVSQASALRRQALDRLARVAGRENETVAAVAWLGYDAPQIPGVGDPWGSAVGGWEVSHSGVAASAAVDLARFYKGIQAAHRGPLHLTAVGHSYGSLVTGLALQQTGHGVSDAVFYGSPGVEALTPGELGLQPGHVFVMRTRDDPIRLVYDAPAVVRWQSHLLGALAPVGLVAVTAADAVDAGEFGPDPASNPDFVQLATGPGSIRSAGAVQPMAGARGHSDYASPAGVLPRTAGYNLAAVVAGLPVVRK